MKTVVFQGQKKVGLLTIYLKKSSTTKHTKHTKKKSQRLPRTSSSAFTIRERWHAKGISCPANPAIFRVFRVFRGSLPICRIVIENKKTAQGKRSDKVLDERHVYPQMSRILQIRTSPKMANSQEYFACTRGNGNCEPLDVHRFRALAAKCWAHGRESRPIRQCQARIE